MAEARQAADPHGRRGVAAKESQFQQGAALTLFSRREDPKVVDYSIKKTYGRLLNMLEEAFSKDKLRALIRLLKTDPVLRKHKVMIFSEYMATARYLKRQLAEAGIEGVDEVDSATARDRGEILRQFSRKTLRISKTFGIEGRKLLTPADDYEALKDFTYAYEGSTSLLEAMHLEYQRLFKDHPDLAESLAGLPGRVFSGKAHPWPESKAVFFCYALPAPGKVDSEAGAEAWTEEKGSSRWYLYDLEMERIVKSRRRSST